MTHYDNSGNNNNNKNDFDKDYLPEPDSNQCNSGYVIMIKL